MAVAALRRVSSSRLVFALVVVVAGLAVVVVVECPGSQRVAAFFAEAMSARVVSSCLGLYTPLSSGNPAAVAARQVLNGISPFVAFEHFTANQAIQEAFEREVRMHIIDLDIMQGLQWPGLFHNLASRLGGPHSIKRTGLGAF